MEQSGSGRYPTPPASPAQQGQDVEENPVKYGENLESGAAGGGNNWQSKPNPEESYSIAAGEKLKAQGNLSARKKLNADEGTIESK
jgi:hypothetical protein